jgi:hypothetical protein
MSGLDPAAVLFQLGSVARAAVALVLALSAIRAMRDWPAHAAIVQRYRLLPKPLAALAARLLPPLSLLAAVALVIPKLAQAGTGLALALMLVFTVAIAINLARGRVAIDCGCGGAAGQLLSPSLVWRNLGLIGLLLAGAALPAAGPLDAGFWLAVPGASLALAALYYAADQMIANAQAFGRGAAEAGR